LAQDEAGQDRAPLSRQTGRNRAREVAPGAVGPAGEPAPPTDEPPALPAGDDMHTAATQQRALVEAVARAPRLPQFDDALDESALRRSTAERKREQHSFTQPATAKGLHSRGSPEPEGRPPGWTCYLDQSSSDLADPWRENAPLERLAPDAAPPEPCDGQSDGQRGESAATFVQRHVADDGHERRCEHPGAGEADEVRRGEPDTQPAPAHRRAVRAAEETRT